MPSNLPQFTIRIEPGLLKKLRYVAEYNARSANREVEADGERKGRGTVR